MTIQALITKVREEKPNSFTDAKLLSYVNEIEVEVAEQLGVEYTTYTSVDTTALLAPAPYDRLYVSYVKAMVDFANEEYASYQMNQTQHVQDFRDFLDWVVRTGQEEKTNAVTRFRNILY